ncbi:MAG: heme exporter protein CcmB [Chloroflexota bacterium]
MGSYLRKLWAIALKDLRIELRTREVLGSMALFSVLAAVVFGLAFDLRIPDSEVVVPGVLWVVMLFAGTLGLNRSFGGEVELGTLAALLLAPVDRSAIFFGKVLANLVLLLITQLLVLPSILILYDSNLFRPWILVSLFFGALGYAIVGAFFAALTAGVHSRETLLPIMLLPVLVPLFLAGVGLTTAVLDGRPFIDFRHWVALLIAYDLIFVVISFLLFDLIWEEVE